MAASMDGDFGLDPEEQLRLHEISDADLASIKAYGKIIIPRLPEYLSKFYNWLEKRPEFNEFFHDGDLLQGVQKRQLDLWASFFSGTVDRDYLQARMRLGEVHARIGLPLPTYFSGMNYSFVIFTQMMYDDSLDAETYSNTVLAITKLLHLDTSIVVDTFSRLSGQKLAEQSTALLEMSTPVTAIWNDILMLPIVGIIDSRRAQDVMAAILSKIVETRARVFIMDISGVAVVDTAVANHLIKITKATKLMGCECMISGLSPAIAQTIVDLGIETGEIKTTATLRDALEAGFKTIDVRVQAIRDQNS